MSESDEHRRLVKRMADKLSNEHPSIVLTTDLQKHPGDSTPGVLDGHKPDIHAHTKDHSLYIIAEAKTGGDLDNIHSRAQFSIFLRYLEKRPAGIFILGVSGYAADNARTMVSFTKEAMRLQKTELQVFDGLDYWLLDRKGGGGWHLI